MLISVTGAGGHIGGNLVRALLDDNRPDVRVRALIHENDRPLAGLPRDRLEIVRADLLDPASLQRAFEGAEVVYHLAARISLVASDAPIMERINVEGTKAVLAACRDAKVRRLVYFSSVHAFSTHGGDRPLTEDSALSDGDDDAPEYDRTKARALRAMRAAVAEGLDAVAVHPTGVIGPHDYKPSEMGTVIRDLSRGTLPALVTGGFNFVDVRDICAGAIAAEKQGRSGESYLLSGEWIAVRDLAAAISQASGTRAPLFTTPMWLARGVAPLFVGYARLTGTIPLFTPAKLHALRTHRVISLDKSRQELGYAPRPIRQSFADTVAWMREQGMIAR